MASPSELCLNTNFSISFPSTSGVKDPFKLKNFSLPLTSMASEPIPSKVVCTLFDRSPKRISVSTTDPNFTGYVNDVEKGMVKNGFFTSNDDVPATFGSSGRLLDRHFVIGVLKFCSNERCIELGRRYHALIIKSGVNVDQFVGTSLVDMYAKCGDMGSAIRLVIQMPCLDVATCNCLISGYTKNRLFDEAFSFFMKFDGMGIRPNHYTYTTMLAVCGSFSAIDKGKQLHAQIVKMQYLSETAVGNALLTMYSKCGMMEDAESLFNSLVKRNVVSWSAIINGFKHHRDFEKALRLICLMREDGIDPNEYTFSIALSSCASMKNLDIGCMFHAQVLKKGMALGDFVGTTIVDMYSGLGEAGDAEKQLKEMGKSASSASWNAHIAGFVHNEKAEEAIGAFVDMVKNDKACDEFTYSIILKACSSLPSLATCEQIHSRMIKAKFESNMHVGSSLIEAYNKCGSVEDAERVFSKNSSADVVSWNSMIKAYSQNGHPTKALALFQKMFEEGIRPTNSTFLAVLSACSHSGLVQEGQKLFESMAREYNIPPEETHYSCMVDLLGRAGQLENALDFIKNLPIKPTAPIWRPLLAACRCHNNLQMAEFIAKQILELDPNDATVYVTLSNMYTEAGQCTDAEKQRKLMTVKDVAKEPGCSWIEMNNKIYRFFSHDKSCPEMPRVYQKLKQVMQQIENKGYTLNAKEDNVALYHSEKLAVCFGLINLTARKRIRVFKNLRVCPDCHSFMNYLSTIVDKEIVLRDNYRFHHFKQGCCSCGDFW
ncbi:hypothetical protein LWI28_024773 [Acer negundo]|uniref:DYW domain-containing protein n=1 Tax=Acer negundo TaxID=4023 RepID=A0AAD5JMV0_ACENE|nr:hypothetical protein LWI28_024773 [Acer negundo]